MSSSFLFDFSFFLSSILEFLLSRTVITKFWNRIWKLFLTLVKKATDIFWADYGDWFSHPLICSRVHDPQEHHCVWGKLDKGPLLRARTRRYLTSSMILVDTLCVFKLKLVHSLFVFKPKFAHTLCTNKAFQYTIMLFFLFKG